MAYLNIDSDSRLGGIHHIEGRVQNVVYTNENRYLDQDLRAWRDRME